MTDGPVCSVDGCDGPVRARGWCATHYHRHWRTGDVGGPVISHRRRPVAERFWECVDRADDDECWTWTGTVQDTGYGSLWVDRKIKAAHRLSYELNVGPIPDGLWILHSCDNPRCVNPAHLRAGTPSDNVADALDRERFRPRRGDGHPRARLTEDEVRSIRAMAARGVSRREIAERLGLTISLGAVGLIIRGKRWKHLLDDDEETQ